MKVIIRACVTDDCEYASRAYEACYFCGEDVSKQGYDVHFYLEDGHGCEHIGNLCYECESSGDEHLRELIKDRHESAMALAYETEQEHRKLIFQVEALKPLIKSLEAEIISKRRFVNIQASHVAKYADLLNAQQWQRVSFEDATRRTQFQRELLAMMPTAPEPQTAKKSGYVYLLASSEGHYKIGRTRDIPSRVNTLRIQLPFPIKLIHHFEVEDCIVAEKELHERFSDKRLNGEWFSLSSEDVEFIKSLQNHKRDQ